MKLTHLIVLLLTVSCITWALWTHCGNSEKEDGKKQKAVSTRMEKMRNLADLNSAKVRFQTINIALRMYGVEHGGAYPKKLNVLALAGMVKKSDLYSFKDPEKKLVYLGGKKIPVDSPTHVLVYDPLPYGRKYVTLMADGQMKVCSISKLNGYLKKQKAPLVKPPAKPKPGSKPRPKTRPKLSGDGYIGTLLKARRQAGHLTGVANMKNLGNSLMLFSAQNGDFPPDLETLVTQQIIQKRALYSIHNAKKKIVYLGKGTDMGGGHDFVLVYDPVADRSGKHIVLFIGGSVKAISKTDLNRRLKKQKAKPAK